MNNREYWLYWEPHTHIEIRDSNILIYDSLSNKFYEYRNNPELSHFLNVLKQNDYILKISKDVIESFEIGTYLKQWRELFLLDFVDVKLSNSKPVNFYPRLILLKGIADYNKSNEEHLGEHIGKFLYELTVHIKDKNEEISIKTFKRILESLESTECKNIILDGEDILLYNQLDELLTIIGSTKYCCKVIIHYEELLDLDKNQINKILLAGCSIIVKIDNFENIDIRNLIEINLLLEKGQIESKFRFSITSENDFVKVQDILQEVNLSNYQIIPLYNGYNKTFFDKNFRISKERLHSRSFNLRDLYINKVINKNYWGKLLIDMKGNVFSNKNSIKLGNINEKAIKDCIYEEMKEKNYWLNVRANDETCSKCLYTSFCPAPSNYENQLNEISFCTIKNEMQ